MAKSYIFRPPPFGKHPKILHPIQDASKIFRPPPLRAVQNFCTPPCRSCPPPNLVNNECSLIGKTSNLCPERGDQISCPAKLTLATWSRAWSPCRSSKFRHPLSRIKILRWPYPWFQHVGKHVKKQPPPMSIKYFSTHPPDVCSGKWAKNNIPSNIRFPLDLNYGTSLIDRYHNPGTA